MTIINQEEKDLVRKPDSVKREKLIEENLPYSDEEMENQEINQAIYLSINEINNQEELNKKFEEETINNYKKMVIERKAIFNSLLLELLRLSKYDKEIKDIYEILEPIIESYCYQYIEFIELELKTYEKIFKVLNTIRIEKKSIEKLKTLLIKQI